MKTFYSLLGVSEDASSEDIEKAYKEKLEKYEDDELHKNKLRKIKKSHRILSNSEKRKKYDEYLNEKRDRLDKKKSQVKSENEEEKNSEEKIKDSKKEFDKEVIVKKDDDKSEEKDDFTYSLKKNESEDSFVEKMKRYFSKEDKMLKGVLMGFGSVLLVVLLVWGIFYYLNEKDSLDMDEAKELAEAYINENLMQGGKATIKEVIDYNDKVYELKIDVGGPEEMTSYMDKDGRNFYPYYFEMTPPEMEKVERPSVELFVMSHCPYGTQAEKAMFPVLDAIGDDIDFEIKFVSYAMHGEKELKEQTNQYCIQRDYNDKYVSYLKCFLEKDEEGQGEMCMENNNIDVNVVSQCASDIDSQYKIMEIFNDKDKWGGTYPPFSVHQEENSKYNVQGSPTLILNGEELANFNRDPNSILEKVCETFEKKPDGCDQELSTEAPAAGFGYTSSSTGDDSGSCN